MTIFLYISIRKILSLKNIFQIFKYNYDIYNVSRLNNLSLLTLHIGPIN